MLKNIIASSQFSKSFTENFNVSSVSKQNGPILTAFVGDSLTNDVSAATFGPQEYQTHAISASGGNIMFGGKFGAGGLGLLTVAQNGKTWQQTLADLESSIIKPQRVCLLIGTNDIGSGKTFLEVKEAYIAAVMYLRSKGYEVVVSELPPRNDAQSDANLRLKLHTFNTWINYWSKVNYIKCNHFYSELVDPAGTGNWKSGYNRDSIHPNVTGAVAMGAVAAKTMSYQYSWKPYLAADNGDATCMANPLMLTDAITSGSSAQTAGDGIPDSWGKANSMPVSYTNSLVSGSPDIIGNWYKQVRDTTAGGPILRSIKIPALVGDTIQFGFKVKTILPTNPSGVSITLNQSNGTAWTSSGIGSLVNPISQIIAGQEYQMDVSTIFLETKVVQETTAGVYIDYQTLTGSGNGGEFYLGQMTLRNLTTLGVV